MNGKAIMSGARVSVIRDEMVVALLVLIWLAIAYAGWTQRDRLPFSTGRRGGYWLGIAGAAQMLVLLGYPLRKRGVAVPGSIGFWFRAHMILGLTGPLLIVIHSRYEWRALNSAVALAATLIVMVSGVVGRFLHLHLYRGFTLHRLRAWDLVADIEAAFDRLAHDPDLRVGQLTRLGDLVDLIHAQPVTLLGAIALRLRLSVLTRLRGRAAHWAIEAQIGQSTRADTAGGDPESLRVHHRQASADLRSLMRAIRTAGAFTLYERLFRWWHLFHLPLFGLLVLSAVLHVYAVHRY